MTDDYVGRRGFLAALAALACVPKVAKAKLTVTKIDMETKTVTLEPCYHYRYSYVNAHTGEEFPLPSPAETMRAWNNRPRS